MWRFIRSPAIVIIVCLAALAGVVGIALWLHGGTSEATAQCVLENACAEAEPVSSVDFSIQLFSNNGVSDGRIEVEVRNTGINYQAFLGSTMIEEKVVIMATVTPSPIGSNARDLEPVQDLVVGFIFVN